MGMEDKADKLIPKALKLKICKYITTFSHKQILLQIWQKLLLYHHVSKKVICVTNSEMFSNYIYLSDSVNMVLMGHLCPSWECSYLFTSLVGTFQIPLRGVS